MFKKESAMKRIDKNGKRRKLNIEFIYKKDGTKDRQKLLQKKRGKWD